MPRRVFYRKIYQKKKRNKNFRQKKGALLLRRLLKLSFFAFLLFVVFCFSLFIYYAKDLPRPEKFNERQVVQSTKIYDRTGQHLLYEMYGEEKREIVPLNLISKHLQMAVITAEDDNFYSHFGLDLKSVGRAILTDLKLRKPVQGASTISQQLIRSSFLTREKTAQRKIREIILTLEMERRYSKEQILEWYLNQVPFGSNAYGAEMAAKTFFNKSASDLTVAESALLASLIKAPSYLSPYGENKDKLLERKDYILEKMARTGYLSQEEMEKAKKEKIKFAEILQPISAPHFVMYVKNYLIKKYGEDFLKERGLKVYTSLDWKLQKIAEKSVSEGAKINENYNAFNAALTAINPKNGQILAMVGSKDWFRESYPKNCHPGLNCLFEPKVNVTTYKIGRQPGSAFKPFVYATAFQKGYNDKTIVIDKETNFGTWGGKEYIPQNYDGKFRGPVTLRQALAQSLNVPSVKVLADLAGLEDSIQTAKKMGITTLTKPPYFYGLSIVLGGGEVKLLDMVSAYGVFAAEGLRVEPVAVLKIEDSEGNVIEENKKTPKRVLESKVCRLINDILSDNEARAPMFGKRSNLYIKGYRVAAKTGTTENYKDAWTIGYTPSIVVGVWAGNNDNSSMSKKTGVVTAGFIWKKFMEKILPEFPKEEFIKPENESDSNNVNLHTNHTKGTNISVFGM